MLKVEHDFINKLVKTEAVTELNKRLKKDYIFPEVAEDIELLLLNKLKKGEYDSFRDGNSFAKAITEDLQQVSKDKHLRVTFQFKEKLKEDVIEKDFVEEFERKAKVHNYGFYKIERLQGNVGYIDLRNFYHLDLGKETAIHAMNFIQNTEALIFDLRKNGGGSPEMVALISSYLFDTKVHLNSFYHRPTDTFSESWTDPNVQGKSYLNKPVFILTSNYTFSAAEEFTYNLKNLKRATVIGETTGGGAHPGGFRKIAQHFRAFIPIGRAINPITKTNWEGTGVQPDVSVNQEEAFDYAYKKALEHVKEQYKDLSEYQFLIDEVNNQLK